MDQLGRFLNDRRERPCFVLRGYAGTGKSSVMGALVRALYDLQQPCVLLAPTGRAAKVLSKYAGFPAYTIHKFIYRREKQGNETFSLGWNTAKHTLFIVDEASMISAERDNSNFGTGSLLDDLLSFVFQGESNRLLLLGDNAQLPPVGHQQSPALDMDFLQGYGLTLHSCSLTNVVRQAAESGILRNATHLRKQLDDTEQVIIADQIEPSHDTHPIPPTDIAELLERSYQEVGEAETIILTRSNWRTNQYNQAIRSSLLWRESELEASDRIMVSRNNYFWTEKYENLPFLANGDMFQVERLNNFRELYGFHFADAQIRSLDYDWEIDVVVWIDTLLTDSPEKSYELQRQLYDRIKEDYPEIRNSKELREKITSSPYFNALQIRYAYAITCHKAQGGQWEHVYIDAGKEEVELRWLYTALTRATNQVWIVNQPQKTQG